MIVFYHQTKTPISFWCRQLNPKSLIQQLETLLVELIRTYKGIELVRAHAHVTH